MEELHLDARVAIICTKPPSQSPGARRRWRAPTVPRTAVARHTPRCSQQCNLHIPHTSAGVPLHDTECVRAAGFPVAACKHAAVDAGPRRAPPGGGRSRGSPHIWQPARHHAQNLAHGVGRYELHIAFHFPSRFCLFPPFTLCSPLCPSSPCVLARADRRKTSRRESTVSHLNCIVSKAEPNWKQIEDKGLAVVLLLAPHITGHHRAPTQVTK